MPASDKPAPGVRREAWRWYAGYLRGRQGALIMAIVPSGLVAFLTLPALWLLRYAIDVAIPAGNVTYLLLAGLGIFICRAGSAFSLLAFGRRSIPAIRGITAEMRCDLVARLHRLRWIDHAALEGAQANGRIVNETERVENLTQSLFYGVIPTILPLIVYAAVLFWISPWLALVFVIAAPLMRLATRAVSMRLQRSIKAFQQNYEQFNTGTQNIVQMLPVARIQGSEAHQNALYRDHIESLRDAGSTMALAGMLSNQTNIMLTAFIAVVMLVAGGLAVVHHLLTIGELGAFILASAQVNSSVASLMNALPVIMSGDEALIRLAEFRQIGREEEQRAGALAPAAVPAVVLDVVSFGYGDRAVLTAQSMRVDPGLITAVAAPNGQGKTTILELVSGLHRPDAGRVLIGDWDLSEVDGAAWRQRIGFVPQHPQFFHGTIRQNICFGRDNVDDTALDRAIHLAGLEPVLARVMGGLDGRMGDRGAMLSGGERQRIAIARALTHRPDLLILDEPSNHLDKRTSELLIERLLLAPDRPTILMATHDQPLLAHADRIYDLADGVLTLRLPLALAAGS
jgi:ABC-type multidrug transport system fused ATPase/permease subunit